MMTKAKRYSVTYSQNLSSGMPRNGFSMNKACPSVLRLVPRDDMKYITAGVIGGCTAYLSVHMGYNFTTWEFWALMALMVLTQLNEAFF